MSEAGREDVWTDLEQLLREGGLGANPPGAQPGGGHGDDPAAVIGGSEDLAAESAGSPFEDLLTELLNSWTEDQAPSAAEAAAGEETPEPEVALPGLMARLLEAPGVSELETTQSIEALQQQLEQDWFPPAVDGGEPGDGGTAQAGHEALEPPETVAELPSEAPRREPPEAAAEDPEQAQPELPDGAVCENAPEEQPESAVPASPLPGFGDLPAPVLSPGLVRSLLGEKPVEAPQELPLLAAGGQAEDGGPFPTPGESMLLLPPPAAPPPEEPLRFEPALPPESALDWPLISAQQPSACRTDESEGLEDEEPPADGEPDDSLRRLVGLMLAEIAAAAEPAERAPAASPSQERTTERFLSFSLGGEVYAVELAGILESDRLPRITRVPGLPAWAIGVTNLRGTILPVVDLRRLLNLEEAENPGEGRILVARPVAADPPAALVVDRLEGVALLALNELHPAPQWLDGKILPYLAGVGSFKGRLVNVLDLRRLFSAAGVNGEEPARSTEAA